MTEKPETGQDRQVELTQQIDRHRGERSIELATLLLSLGMARWDAGNRNGALPVMTEATDLYRDIGDTAGLARALTNLAVFSSELGDRAAAGEAAQSSLNAYRRLAEANPTGFQPDLAASLNNYALSLSALGRPNESLTVLEEALDIRRSLADTNPAAFTPDLAASLNNYAIRLAELGRHLEALPPSEEALTLYRSLADTNPAAFTPDLAATLNNYATFVEFQSPMLAASARQEAAKVQAALGTGMRSRDVSGGNKSR